MTTINQITYQARTGSSGLIFDPVTSLTDQATRDLWWRRLEPWLRAGSPEGCAYLNFETEAAFIRWYHDPASHYDWNTAHVLVGPADILTGPYALELTGAEPASLYQPEAQLPLIAAEQDSDRDTIEARARSAEAAEQLTPLLAHALRGEAQVTMPWTMPALPEAVMWGLLSILAMTGETRPVSFLTYMASSRRYPVLPGLFIGFSPDLTRVVPPDPGFITPAETLVARFADDPAVLRELLARHRTEEPADHAGRIGQLLRLLPLIQRGTASRAEPSDSAFLPSGVVMCPMCLHEIDDWDSLGYWRWDLEAEKYVELKVPPDLNATQLERALRVASVRCPSAQGGQQIGTHFLPADYGRFGAPVVLGFVGLTKSGKSHLLASMIGAITERALEELGISSIALDHGLHRRYLDNWVVPLKQGKMLPGTREGIVDFADAFLIKGQGSAERVVALFDVAGGDLTKLEESTEFLWVADGMFFVIDSERMKEMRLGDQTFSNVLDVVRRRARNEAVSAAIILNKADVLRFDEPVDRWLQAPEAPADGRIDAVEFLRESADVYAFLDGRNALAMAEPYEVCPKATMHVVSPTGGAVTGDVYPRGVTPRRVLRPLVAMLAMTGVLTGPDAEQVGV